MRIIIYGAGAIGSIIGGHLHNCGQETILVCSKSHADAISQSGLAIGGVRGDYTINLPAVTDIAQIEFQDSDVVFLTMKTFDTEAAIKKIGNAASRLVAVCFQNGVRNEEFAATAFARVYGGIVFLGAKYLEPGMVTHTAENSLGLGLYPEGLDETVDELSTVLTSAGFSVTPYARIMAVKWSKLFRNLNNALFAITGLSVLEGIKYEEPRLLMADTLEEALRVTKAAGIEIIPLEGQPTPEKSLEFLRKPGDRNFEIPRDEQTMIRPSTWQDLYLGRGRTEVDYLNGEIVQLGQKHGIPTPLNALLAGVVSSMAREEMKPGAYTASELRAMSNER
jgi:2-dehydropantoate 2-reductase